MNCDELRESYELYTLGVIEEPERAELNEHLQRHCSACERGLRHALETNYILASMAPSIEPPKSLRRKVLAGVGAEKSAWGWNFSWGAVTAALMVAVLWFSVQNSRRAGELSEARRQIANTQLSLSATRSELTTVRRALEFLNEPDTRVVSFGKPRGRVLVHPSRGVLLLASDLPPAPPGKIYEMWVIPKGRDAVPRPAGLFRADATGNAMHLLAGPVDVGTTAAVAVTVEPEAGSPAPTSTPLLVAAL